MQISYLGHSSFKIKTKTATLVTDPYSSKVGFKMPKVEAEIVTVSHDHYDHNFVEAVKGRPFVITGPGEYEIKEVGVHGLATYHDAKEGEDRGNNTVYLITAEDLTVCHLGDLGHQLSARMVEEIGEIDVLLIPVGGQFTIGPKRAVEVITQVEPRIVVPMHYRINRHQTEGFSKVLPVDAFLKQIGVEYKKEDRLVVSKSGLEEEMEVVVLKERT